MTKRSISASVVLMALLLGAMTLCAEVANWSVQSTSNKTGEQRCYLVTPVKTIDDGYGETKVSLELRDRELLVVTDSSIDGEFGDLGLQVDDREIIMADGIRADTRVFFHSRINEITDQFLKGLKVRVQLRFWPTWPTTGLRSAEFSLIGFTKAYNNRSVCGRR